MSSSRFKVFLALTAYDSRCDVLTMISVVNNMETLRKAGYEPSLTVQIGDCYIDQARNKLCQKFLGSDCDNMIFIDNDLQFDGDAMLKLMKAPENVQIVGGAYPYRNPNQEGWPIDIMVDENKVPVGDRVAGLIKCGHVPTGLMRISRKALEKMKDEGWKDQDGMYKFFRTGMLYKDRGDMRWWGEDVFFCKDANEKGVQVWCEPRINFSHIGRHGTFGNYDEWLKKNSTPVKA